MEDDLTRTGHQDHVEEVPAIELTKLRGVDGVGCWFWKPTGEFGGFNICRNTAGDPRSAFYTLAGYNA